MLDQFESIVGKAALVALVALPLLVTVYYRRKYNPAIGNITLFFWLLGPLTILNFMSAHLLGVVVVDGKALIDHTKTFDFRMYSLILMGIVFCLFGLKLFSIIHKHVQRIKPAGNNYWRISILFNLLAIPVASFNPGALFFTASGLISVIAFFSIRNSWTVDAEEDYQLKELFRDEPSKAWSAKYELMFSQN